MPQAARWGAATAAYVPPGLGELAHFLRRQQRLHTVGIEAGGTGEALGLRVDIILAHPPSVLWQSVNLVTTFYYYQFFIVWASVASLSLKPELQHY